MPSACKSFAKCSNVWLECPIVQITGEDCMAFRVPSLADGRRLRSLPARRCRASSPPSAALRLERLLGQPEGGALGVLADRPSLPRVHHASPKRRHPLQRLSDVVDREIGQRKESPGPRPRSCTPTVGPTVRVCHPSPSPGSRTCSSTSSRPAQKRRARAGSSAGNSIRDSEEEDTARTITNLPTARETLHFAPSAPGGQLDSHFNDRNSLAGRCVVKGNVWHLRNSPRRSAVTTDRRCRYGNLEGAQRPGLARSVCSLRTVHRLCDLGPQTVWVQAPGGQPGSSVCDLDAASDLELVASERDRAYRHAVGERLLR